MIKSLKIELIIFFFIIPQFLFLGLENINKNPSNLISMYNKLYNLIEKNKDNNQEVYKALQLFHKKFKSGLVYFIKSTNKIEDVSESARFIYKPQLSIDEQTVYIEINQTIIDLFQVNQTIVYSILIHEIKHAYDYFNINDLFTLSASNIIEGYLFELDAVHIQALFIQDILLKNNYKLAYFEKEIIKSYRVDSLQSYSLFFLGVDGVLVTEFYDLLNKKYNKKDVVEKIIEISNKIIEAYNIHKKKEENEDIEMYKLKIKLLTYSNYLPQLLFDFISFFDKKFILSSDFSIEKFYPEINILYNEIASFISSIECKDYLNENRQKLNYFYITKGEM